MYWNDRSFNRYLNLCICICNYLFYLLFCSSITLLIISLYSLLFDIQSYAISLRLENIFMLYRKMLHKNIKCFYVIEKKNDYVDVRTTSFIRVHKKMHILLNLNILKLTWLLLINILNKLHWKYALIYSIHIQYKIIKVPSQFIAKFFLLTWRNPLFDLAPKSNLRFYLVPNQLENRWFAHETSTKSYARNSPVC